jgi:hypothetical protein
MRGQVHSSTAKARVAQVERRRQALQLRILNADYDTIAEKTGIPRVRVGAELKSALAEVPLLEVTEYRKVEVARLDMLARAYWARALKGDIKAAALIVKISERRADLLGLDQRHNADGPGLGDIARALPTGARLSVEKVSPIWNDQTVIGAIQKAYREKIVSPPLSDEAKQPAPVDNGAIEDAETLEPDDPDERLYAEVAAERLAQGGPLA